MEKSERQRCIEKASDLLGMTHLGFTEWITSFQPDYQTYKTEAGIGCFWTDGDDGLIWFCPECDIFAEQGVRVETLSRYCDIDFDSMLEIQKLLASSD